MSAVVVGNAESADAAFCEGMEAVAKGVTLDCCPYADGDARQTTWRGGWEFASGLNARIAAHFHS